jgi:dipeptidase E
MRLLLFSNSTNAGEDYLAYTLPYISNFTGNKNLFAIFIPFAGVTISWDTYYKTVAEKLYQLGISLQSLHSVENALKAIEEAQLIICGGGNTFNLLKSLQDKNLLGSIRKKIVENTPFIGWSAGSNIACPTICTTNDMPIVQPSSFNSLNLVPFQINPHYTDARLEQHAGETREMRINEYLVANPHVKVAGLREGTLFELIDNKLCLKGSKPCRIFQSEKEAQELNPGDDFSFLMQ